MCNKSYESIEKPKCLIIWNEDSIYMCLALWGIVRVGDGLLVYILVLVETTTCVQAYMVKVHSSRSMAVFI
jgi:hypothetical protein